MYSFFFFFPILLSEFLFLPYLTREVVQPSDNLNSGAGKIDVTKRFCDPCLRNVEQISCMWGKKLCKDPQKMRLVPTKVQFTRQANHAPICTQLFLNSWVPRIIMSDLGFSCSPRAIFCSIWSYQSTSISNKNYECQWVVGMDFQNLESHFWTSI